MANMKSTTPYLLALQYLVIVFAPLFFSSSALGQDTASSSSNNYCKDIVFHENSYSVCEFSLFDNEISLFLQDSEEQPIGTFTRLEEILLAQDKELFFAMNAGMYDHALFPIGYFVTDGEVLKKANTNDGPGNFHLKPNGIFYLYSDEQGNRLAGVRETSSFLSLDTRPDFATQSGPMLIIDGNIHPKFRKNSSSRKKRNGVGVSNDGKKIWFAITKGRVNFYEFASLFKEKYGVSNALFLDGTISKLYARDLDRHDKGLPMGPIVGIARPKDAGN